jgi:hypothetical protein
MTPTITHRHGLHDMTLTPASSLRGGAMQQTMHTRTTVTLPRSNASARGAAHVGPTAPAWERWDAGGAAALPPAPDPMTRLLLDADPPAPCTPAAGRLPAARAPLAPPGSYLTTCCRPAADRSFAASAAECAATGGPRRAKISTTWVLTWRRRCGRLHCRILPEAVSSLLPKHATCGGWWRGKGGCHLLRVVCFITV